jgi:heptosyltransferase-3
MMTNLDLPERPRILVITLRRLGDVLLTTPLIRTLKASFAGSSVTALVFRGTEGMLAGNPDVDEVLTTSLRPSVAEMTAWCRIQAGPGRGGNGTRITFQ